jgi:hypothetical protein
LYRGGVRLVVTAEPSDHSLPVELALFERQLVDQDGVQLLGDHDAVTTTGGVTGVRGQYTTNDTLGVYAVFVHDLVAVHVLVTGPKDDMTELRDEINQVFTSVAFREPS